VPNFIEPETEAPLPGREEMWSLVMDYRSRLALEERNLREAERLQRLIIERDRQWATPLLAQPLQDLDDEQKNQIRSLAAAVGNRGDIQRESGNGECVAAYKEALDLEERIGDQALAALSALHLGHAHKDLLQDLAEAEHWYRRSLQLCDAADFL